MTQSSEDMAVALKPEAFEAAIDAMCNDAFIDDAYLLGTRQQDQRLAHYAETAIRAYLAALPGTVQPVAVADLCCLLREAREWVELGPELPGVSLTDEVDARSLLSRIDAALAASQSEETGK